jgi:hypothetical protein
MRSSTSGWLASLRADRAASCDPKWVPMMARVCSAQCPHCR